MLSFISSFRAKSFLILLMAFVFASFSLANVASADFETVETTDFRSAYCEMLGIYNEGECEAYWYWVIDTEGTTFASHGEDQNDDDLSSRINREIQEGYGYNGTGDFDFSERVLPYGSNLHRYNFKTTGGVLEIRYDDKGVGSGLYTDAEGNVYTAEIKEVIYYEDGNRYVYDTGDWVESESSVDGGDEGDEGDTEEDPEYGINSGGGCEPIPV